MTSAVRVSSHVNGAVDSLAMGTMPACSNSSHNRSLSFRTQYSYIHFKRIEIGIYNSYCGCQPSVFDVTKVRITTSAAQHQNPFTQRFTS